MPLFDYQTKTVTIASGATGLSAEVDLEGYQVAAIVMPATWVTADITFQVASESGGTFQSLYDDFGVETRVIGPTQGTTIGIDASAGALASARYVKLRSGTSGSPVNQTATRTLTLILKK